MSVRAKAYVALLIAIVIWGATLVIVKPSLAVVSPAQFLFFRFFLVVLVMALPMARYLKTLRLSPQRLAQVTLLEFLGTPVALVLLYAGLARTTAVESSLLAATLPIFITVGGVWFLRERQQVNESIGLLLGIIGTVLIVLDPVLAGNGMVAFSAVGNVLVLGFLIATAAYYLLAKVAYQDLPKSFIGGYSALVAVPALLVLLYLTDDLPTLSSLAHPAVIVAVVYSAFLSWLVAFPLYLYGQENIEASEASLFKYGEGVVAIPTAWLLLGERPSPILWLAIGLIAVGVFVGARRFQQSAR